MEEILTMKRLASPWMFVFGLFLGFAVMGTAWAYQTHMHNALNALYTAKNQLNMAMADKGGHRVNAINLVNQAIGEVQAGIAAGAR
jgi:hypothetical protein